MLCHWERLEDSHVEKNLNDSKCRGEETSCEQDNKFVSSRNKLNKSVRSKWKKKKKARKKTTIILINKIVEGHSRSDKWMYR